MYDTDKNSFNKFKQIADEMTVQLNLGASEAKDELAEKRKELRLWASDIKNKLIRLKMNGQNEVQSMIELMVSLEEDLAETSNDLRDTLEKRETALSRQLDKVTYELDKLKEKGDSELLEFRMQAQQSLDELQTQFDLLRLQAHLGSREAADTLEATRQDVEQKFEVFKNLVTDLSDSSEQKWQHLQGETKQAFKQLKESVSF